MAGGALPYDWERDGNTLWVACPSCAWTLPITSSMAENNKVDCFCPACETEFNPRDNLAGPAVNNQ